MTLLFDLLVDSPGSGRRFTVVARGKCLCSEPPQLSFVPYTSNLALA